ncbi:MAG: hypothetical protein JRN08_05385 [Nitrososphaerota archaeon]|nr:hypothetical protein [Nitrososphaerota archaeon]
MALVVLWVAVPVQAAALSPHAKPAGPVAFSESLRPNNTAQGSHSAIPFWNNSSVWEGYTFGFPPASSPWGAFGLTYAFGGQIQLTGGAVDAGTNRTGRVMVEAPSYSELNITVASQSVSVPLPNPLGMNQSLTVASLDLQLDVPYLGSVTLADFSLAIVVSVEIEGDSTVAGCGTGAGHPIWDGSGGFGLTACARNLTVGSSFGSALSNISLVLAAGVQAEAEITPLYTDVIPIIPLTPLVPLPAPVSSVQSTFSVVSPLSHLHAYLTPNPTVYGDPVYVFSNVSGGAGNITYSYNGMLPGSGCSPVGQGILTCTATSSGSNFSMEVIASDQEGTNVSRWVSYSASPPPAVQDASWSLPSWSEVEYGLEILGGIVFGILVLIGVIGYLGNRRDYPASREPYEEEFSTDHCKTALDYEITESARPVAHHSPPSRSNFATEMRSTATKSASTLGSHPRDPRSGRFVRSSSSEGRSSGTNSTRGNGNRSGKRTHR